MSSQKLLTLALILAWPALMICSFPGAALSQESLPTVSAKEFWQEFEADRPQAEAKYLGRTLNYTGVVVETGTSIYLTPNVMLSDGSEGRTYLICVLPRADADKLAGFKKGDQVTMTGRAYRAKAGGGVVIKECKRADNP